MRYGLDLDGVMVDMHRGFNDVVNELWPGRIVPHAQPSDWDMTSLGLTQSEIGQTWNKIKTIRNWWYGLPAYTDSVSAVFRHRLKHPEDEIFYVTARTTETEGMPIMHQSQRWLEMCGISGLGTAVIVAPPDAKKIDIYEEIGVDYALDDALHIAHEGSHIIYLLERPWNENGRSKGLDVVGSVDEFFGTTRRECT
jgi:hypothetical protein